jgi:hypothetical protein
MKTKPGARTGWVWTALVLQGVIFLLSGQSLARLIASWAEYVARGVNMLPFVLRSAVEAGLAGASLIGLWRRQRWGWFLGVLTNGVVCAQVLWSLLEVGVAVVRSPIFLVFSVLDFAAFVVFLHDPVRKYFLGSNQHGEAVARARGSGAGPNQPIKPLRVMVYFVVATMAACIATAFTVTLLIGQKAGGGRGFVLILYFGLMGGSAASFLFVLILTMVVHKSGLTGLWLWLLLGGGLAPVLILALGLLGRIVFSGALSFLFYGPVYLSQAWWVTPPIGVVTAWVCFVMYPWGFSQPR